jgi:hypothetical protein
MSSSSVTVAESCRPPWHPLITGLYAVRNPEKLSHMERETALRR